MDIVRDDGRYFYDDKRRAYICHQCDLKLESYCHPYEPACTCYDSPVTFKDLLPKSFKEVWNWTMFLILCVVLFAVTMILVGCVTVEQPKPLTKEDIYGVVRDLR